MKKCIVGVLAAVVFLLAGCAPTSDPTTVACEKILSKMKSLITPETLPSSSDFYGLYPGFTLGNEGPQTRANLMAEVQIKWPWILESTARILDANPIWDNFEGDGTDEAEYVLLRDILSETPFQFNLTSQQENEIFTGKESGYELIREKEAEVFGLIIGEPDGVCGGERVPQQEVPTADFIGTTGNVWISYYVALLDASNDFGNTYLTATRCQIAGESGGWPCATEESVPETVIPDTDTEPRNPFLDPYPNKDTQNLAVFSWCWNQGLEVNSSGTDCI